MDDDLPAGGHAVGGTASPSAPASSARLARPTSWSLANGATAPTAAQIKLGNDAGDTPALKSGSLSLTADTENSEVVTGLAAATDFDVYVVAEDSVPNLTTPVAIDIATLPLDLTAPSWTSGYPLVDTVTSSGFTVRASIDEAGTAYYVVVADGASAPSAAQIKAGNGRRRCRRPQERQFQP